MGGSDNLAAGFRGAADAAQDILGKYIDYQFARKYKKDLMGDEMELYKAKLPLQTAATVQEKQLESDIAFKRAMALLPAEEASKIRVAQATPGMIYDAESGSFTRAPTGGKIYTNPKPGKEPGLEALIREAADNLPKQKTAAMSQKVNISSIDKALNLVDKGVTGKGGQLKALLAPYAEFAGVNTESMNDAQTYQLLTRVIVGPMRLDIIGPGPVSEWEQKLMQEISGGGGTAKSAAKELLTSYRRMAENKVNDYNTTVKGAYSLSPRFKDLYQPIDVGGFAAPLDISGKASLDSKKAALREKLKL